jgi:hypothetical protein
MERLLRLPTLRFVVFLLRRTFLGGECGGNNDYITRRCHAILSLREDYHAPPRQVTRCIPLHKVRDGFGDSTGIPTRGSCSIICNMQDTLNAQYLSFLLILISPPKPS